jgi:hypothetical protein
MAQSDAAASTFSPLSRRQVRCVFIFAAAQLIAIAMLSLPARATDGWELRISDYAGSSMIFKVKQHKNDNDDDDDDDGKNQKKKGGGNQGERSCPPGYVVLKEKNKYGAFCEPAGGNKPSQPETAKCKLGMIGTPPNDCQCPSGTVFQGYKGCVKKVPGKYCKTFPEYRQEGIDAFRSKCYADFGVENCTPFEPNTTKTTCCCTY